MSASVFSEKCTIWPRKPTKENSNCPFSTGNTTENRPLASVAVPTEVPINLTVTPGIGCFFVSYTNPLSRIDFFSGSSIFDTSRRKTTNFSLTSKLKHVPCKHCFNTLNKSSFSTLMERFVTFFTSSLENKKVYPDCSCNKSRTCRRVPFFTSKLTFC